MQRLIGAAALAAALLAADEAAADPDPGISGDSSPLYSLLMQRPGGNSLYLARDELIRPVLATDQELDEAYLELGLKPPSRIFRAPPAQGAGFRRSGSLFTFMLRRSFDLREISYDVPVALVPDDTAGASDRAYDSRYVNGPCAGLGRLEADLRGRCVLGPGRYGLIEERMPSSQLMNFGLYHSFSHELPQNGTRADPSALLYRALPGLIGFASSFSEKGYDDPLSSFDTQLYSRGAGRRVLYGDTLYVLGDFAKGKSLESVCGYRDRIVCRDVRLVRGNHDKRFADAESPFQEELDYVELTHREKRICCMHYPMLSWHGMERGSIMLHGHIHAGKAYNLGNRSNGVLRFDAGVDANGYAPVSADEVVRFFEGVEPSGGHHWREWGGR